MPTRCIFFLGFFLFACSGDLSQPSACEGFADRELGITAEEYRPCASQIMAALDSVQPHLESVVFDSAQGPEREAAGRAYGRLRTLVRQTGIEDDYRSFRPGTVPVKWPDRDVSAFNQAVFQAMVQYMAVLAHPNEDNFGQGKRAHEEAQRFYRQIE